MKYSTVIVAACIGGASLATAVHPGSNPHPQLNTPKLRKPSLPSNTKHSVQRVGNHDKQFVNTAVEAKSRHAQSQHGGNLVHDVNTLDNSSAGGRVALPPMDSLPRRLRKVKGPQRLPKQEKNAHKVKPSMIPDAQRTTEGMASAETGPQPNTGDPLSPSPAPIPSGNELNMEARGLDIEDLDARTFDDVESLLGRNFVDSVKANYRIRKAKHYEKKVAKEKALAGIQTPSNLGAESEVQDPVESLSDQVTARGYDEAEPRTRDLVQSMNAAADTIFRKKPITSNPSASGELEARGYDDAELGARGNIFEEIGRGVGAVVDTFKGKTHASPGRVSSKPPADSSIATESSMNENAPMMARENVDHESLDARDFEEDSLNSRDSSDMELFERDVGEELAARGYDVTDLETRHFLRDVIHKITSHKNARKSSALHKIHSHKNARKSSALHKITAHRDSRKSAGLFDHSNVSLGPSSINLGPSSININPSSRVAPGRSSMDADSSASAYPPMGQPDFVGNGDLDSRDTKEDHIESRDLSDIELLERSIREELAARGYDDGDLEARSWLSTRDFEIDELD